MKAHDCAGQIAADAGVSRDEALIMNQVCDALLLAVANGLLDLNQMAREELANRGLDHTGRWVGFERAAQLAAA